MPPAPSTRWCPTPEQLMILEEMYRSGLRTPNAAQIQQITAHLTYYGKIEGKNVFYWFQNHKARDRQKLRRKLSRHQHLLHLHQQQQQLLLSAASASASGAVSMVGGVAAVPQYLPHTALVEFPFNLHTQSHCHHPFVASVPVHQQLLHQQGTYLESCSPGTMNLVHKLESCGRKGNVKLERSTTPMNGATGDDVHVINEKIHAADQPRAKTGTLITDEPLSSNIAAICHRPPCCRPPLITLDLFPTKNNGGLRDKCAAAAAVASKSSSCSTSITN